MQRDDSVFIGHMLDAHLVFRGRDRQGSRALPVRALNNHAGSGRRHFI